MPHHPFQRIEGRIARIEIDSESLRNNMLADPARREVWVYLPPEYDEQPHRAFPLLVALAPFTGSGPKLLSWQAFGESLPQRLERLQRENRIGSCIVALPDGFSSLGGNQYVNTPVLGRWSDFLLDEMLPELEQAFRVLPGARHRAVFGKSSGGYGALIQGLLHGKEWAAIACQSGDIGFDVAFRRDLPVVLGTLAAHESDPVRFVEYFRSRPKVQGDELFALMFLALAASYDPAPDEPLGIRLPMDPETCALIPERWDRWLAHDPLTLVEVSTCLESLRKLRGLFLDCGSRDQYHLHFGARAFHKRLSELQIDHVYEEFDDTHSGIDYRLDRSLPYLYDRIRAPA